VIDGGESRATEAVTSGLCADHHQHIADTAGSRAHDTIDGDNANTHRIHKRVAIVAVVKENLTTDRRYSEAVTVTADSGDHMRIEVCVTWFIQRAESQPVEQRDRAGTHREDVANNSTTTGGCTFIWFHCTWVVVALCLEYR